MQSLTVSKKELRQVVAESVREALGSELMKLRLLTMPSVSAKEQKEIQKSLDQADRTIDKRINVRV